MKHQYRPLFFLCCIFLTVGALFCMNDILLPSLITEFKLSYTQATFIQLSFYLTYIVFPIPISMVISKFGYKTALILALAFTSLGCLLFVPAFLLRSYPIVLISIFIISTGITIINVAANPYVSILGDPEGAHIRMNFVQVFSRIGYAVTPLAGTALIYSNSKINFHYPYILIAVITFLIAIAIIFSAIPALKPADNDKFSIFYIFRESKKYPQLFFGIFAMFFYSGAEACTAGFFIPYMKSVLGFTDQVAASFLTAYYILASLIGFAAVFALKFIKANRLVGFFGLGMITLLLICIFFQTGFNQYLMAGLGVFLSIMFPTLFSLAIEGIGEFTNKASALLNISLIGGSVFPPLQGVIADNFGVNYSYTIPCVCFIFITYYAFSLTKNKIV